MAWLFLLVLGVFLLFWDVARATQSTTKTVESIGILTYLWVLGLSAWGGIISFLRKKRAGEARPFNFAEMIGEIMTSAFSGVLTFWLCESAGMDSLMTAVLVGISGHMGSRALFQLERLIEERVGIKRGGEQRDGQ